jgi:hypothetical protein
MTADPAAISAYAICSGVGAERAHLLRRRQLPIRPAMTSGDDARRAVVAREVDEGDDRRQLQLGVRPGNVAPHGLVAVQPLLLRTGAPLQEVTQVELVARARWQENAVAYCKEERVAHDLGCERR